MTNKRIKESFSYQQDIYERIYDSEKQKSFLEICEQKKKELLDRRIDQYEKDIITQDYVDFIAVYKKVWLEKGDEISLDKDVRPLISNNNVWLKILDRVEKSSGSDVSVDEN